MRKFILLLLLINSLSAYSGDFVLRAGYSYSPEDGLLLFPPVHFSVEYQFASTYTSYLGLCTGGNLAILPSGGVGVYYGFKMKSFFIENRLNWFLYPGDQEYRTRSTCQFSINPKIGFEKYHLYIKAGPNFGINQKPENLPNINYLHIGKIMMDVEAGFYLNVSEVPERSNRYFRIKKSN